MSTAYRSDFRGAILLALGPTLAPLARWNNSTVPTLAYADVVLSHLVQTHCPNWRTALLNDSLSSALDTEHGHYEPIMADLALVTPATVPEMSLAFSTHISPLGSARTTRRKAWRNWCTVLTWAAGRRALDNVLPMSTAVLHALIWDCTAMGASRSVTKAIVDAIISRHRGARLPSLVTGHMAYHRLTRCLARLLGTQHPHKMGITRDMVV